MTRDLLREGYLKKKKWRNIELETRKKGRGIGDHKTGESKQFLKRKEITKRMLLENKNLYRAKS